LDVTNLKKGGNQGRRWNSSVRAGLWPTKKGDILAGKVCTWFDHYKGRKGRNKKTGRMGWEGHNC